ncbi:MAG: hypothetical protein AAF958_14515, partial [Planctomycetota bacterium]
MKGLLDWKAWLDRLQSISMAAKVACVSGIVLLLLAVVVLWLDAQDAQRVAWNDYMTPARAVSLTVLWFLSVVAIYASVRVWTGQTPLGHEGVRNAWNGLIKHLHRENRRLDQQACYVMLGAASGHDVAGSFARDASVPMPSTQPQRRSIDWFLRAPGLVASLHGVGEFALHRV